MSYKEVVKKRLAKSAIPLMTERKAMEWLKWATEVVFIREEMKWIP